MPGLANTKYCCFNKISTVNPAKTTHTLLNPCTHFPTLRFTRSLSTAGRDPAILSKTLLPK